MIHPLTKLRLSHVRTQAEALEVWRDHWNELHGYSFVLSEPTGGNAMRLPARMDFPEGGHLRSAFAHDNLWFLSHETISRTLAEGAVYLPIDYSIAFDSNVASYLRAWMKGSSAPVVPMLQKVLLQLNQGRFNWDLIPFLLERSEAILSGRDSTEIYETALASEWLGCSDLQEFKATGTIGPTLSQAQIEQKARKAIDDWRHLLKNGQMDTIRHFHNLFHASIAKMVLLQLASPRPSSAATKLEQFLLFADSELQCMSQLCASAALEFFSLSGSFAPMAKLANPAPDLRARARNVAWDFLQLQWRQEFAGNHGRNGAFHIPLFLTFDHGLARLADIFPQRSCLYGGALRFPIFFQDFDFAAQVMSRYPGLAQVIAKIFTPEAHNRRALRLDQFPPDMPTIIQQLESELAHFEHT